MDESGDESQRSGSEDEPLVPDIIDDEFYTTLSGKIAEITKVVRQKDGQENAENVQRMFICCNRYKSDFHMEQMRCQELVDDLAKMKERLEATVQMSRLDQDTIGELRAVIESAWKQRDIAQDREQVAQEEVIKLHEKLENMAAVVQSLSEKKSGLSQKKVDESNQREKLTCQVRDINKQLQTQRLYTTEVEIMNQTLEEKNKELVKLLDETSTEAYNSKKRIDVLVNDLTSVTKEEQKLLEQIGQIKSQNEHLTKTRVKLNLQVLSLKSNLQQLNTQHNTVCNKLAKIAVDLEYAIQEKDKNKRNLEQREQLLKIREEEIIKLKQESAKLTKSQDSTARKYSTLHEAKRKAEEENTRLKNQLTTQEKELSSMRLLVHHFEKQNTNLISERDVLKRDMILEQAAAEKREALLQESQHEIRSFRDTTNILEVKQKKLRNELSKMSQDRDKKLEEIQNLGDKTDALQNEIHLKENFIIELKRTINETETKCSKFQAQHDVLANEKNALLRTLHSVDDEKSRLKNQITETEQDVDKLKERIATKETDIGKLQSQIDRLEKERRMLKSEIRNIQMGHHHTRSELLEKRMENDRFSKSLQEDAHKFSRIKRELDNVLQEKNAVSAQLTKRNDDFAQLKNCLENLQAAYDQTEKQYGQCQDDMRLMKIEIKNLRTERDVLRKDRECSADLRRELLQTHRVLNQERIKARALQDEMLTPMNIHRWRNLRGKDPEKMDLIHRIQLLRKKILAQDVSAIENERALDEYQRLYEALREFMLKLPSYKVKQELNEVKANLCSKEKKVKALTAELNSKDADQKSKDSMIDELKTNLASAKVNLLAEKKKKQKLLEERHILAQMQVHCFSAPPNMQRTAVLGGGFKLLS